MASEGGVWTDVMSLVEVVMVEFGMTMTMGDEIRDQESEIKDQ